MVVFSNEHVFINVSEKEIFKKIAIVELAPMNAVLCKFAQELIEEIPSYFWSVGASSTGKHHPEFSSGDGGLARHSLMAYRWLKNMIETNPSDIDDLFSAAYASICSLVETYFSKIHVWLLCPFDLYSVIFVPFFVLGPFKSIV